MRLDQMPYHAMPTLAVHPFRKFEVGWTWQLRALKIFPDYQLSWRRYYFDNGSGHARGAVFNTYEEAAKAADEFNESTSDRIAQAVADSVLQASTTLKVDKAITAARRIHDEETLMESEAIKQNAHLPRPAAEDLELHSKLEMFREALHLHLHRAPYLQFVALPGFNICLHRTGELTWEGAGTLTPKLSQLCLRELTARGFGLSGADHWGRTKARIRSLLLPRANQLLQLASVKQMLAEAQMLGQRVLVCGGFVFWFEDDGQPRWVVKNAGGESDSDEGATLWHEGTILSKNHGRIVVLPYIKESGEKVQGHTKNAPHDGKALPRHRDQYVNLPFKVLDGDLMLGLFGELYYE